jgi:CspA family cold shock protein
VGETPKGTQVMEVVETCKSSETRAETTTGAKPEIAETVKWYDPEKGFGFIAPDDK